MNRPRIIACLLASGLPAVFSPVVPARAAEDLTLHSFKRIQLSDDYFSEGAAFGDFNHDGQGDVVAGPYWYEGPEFTRKHEIQPAKPQDRNRYADNFFSFVHDIDSDGWDDVLVVGFPGTPASWFRNPQGKDGHWDRHEVFDWVSNESPDFTQLVGDATPELVCTRAGKFGYATVNRDDPKLPWTFHAISDIVAAERFGHGLGVGDIDGDKRLDVIAKNGWFQQPEAAVDSDALWTFHPYEFTKFGGAQMVAYDIDGDGDNDVVTSLRAHDHGLAWFEQKKSTDGGITFDRHLIMGNRPSDNPYGVVFSELHALAAHDMDGDGLDDIVTGKTYWSHHTKTPGWHDGAVVYWFKLVRDNASGQVEFIPHQADDDSGVGRQVTVGDINHDTLPDIITANMKGTFVLLHETKNPLGHAEWAAAQPKRRPAGTNANPPAGTFPLDENGKPLNTGFETGSLEDWTAEGGAFTGQPAKGEIDQNRKWGEGKHANPQGEFWIGGFEIALDDKATGTLKSKSFTVSHPFASYRIGGGGSPGVRMELVSNDSGKVIFRTHGRNTETMFPEVVDLTAHQGKQIFIRLVDDQSSGFGHLNFDDFRFHQRPPVFPDAVNQVKVAR